MLIYPLPMVAEQKAHETPQADILVRPWEWTLDHRLARRFDVAEVRRRAAEHLADRHQRDRGMQSQSASNTDVFVIDGSKDPGLFLPYELMNALSRGISSDPHLREAVRRSYRQRIERFGWRPDEFWARLEGLSNGYSDVIDREARVQDELLKAQTPSVRERLVSQQAALRRSLCQQRAALLRAARAAFGGNEFDRFLYTAIAPYLSVSSRVPPPSEAAKLRELEEGCR